jgi:cytochrome oxidase Cu insertion factor (SCO1/SenC/PrrC family)
MTGRISWLLAFTAVAMVGCGDSDPSATLSKPPSRDAVKTDGEISAVAAKDKSDANAPEKPQATVGDWLEGDDRIELDLDFNLTNQDGDTVNLADLNGKPIAVTFFFTSCPNPNMCPLIVLTMAHLQRDLEKAGLTDDVHTLLISYDPTRDTPERMKKYGADRGFRFDNGMMLRPGMDEYIDLLHALSISIQPLSDGTINHVRELLIIDADGRYVRDYHGEIWDNQMVLDDLRRLVAEKQNPGVSPAD